MGESFSLFDKNNNIQKESNVIVKFVYEGKDYLIYCVTENEQNKQIFVSRLITNSEGKTFIEGINADEKGKLSNLVYNIVILLPSEFKKSGEAKKIIEEFSSKLGVKLSSNVPLLGQQEYYSNCSVAITSKELVESATTFYKEYLQDKIDNRNEIPMWTVPDSFTVQEQSISTPQIDSQTLNDSANVQPNISSSFTANQTPEIVLPVSEVSGSPATNPQSEKLAVVSDPNLANAVGIDSRSTQPNMARNNSSGFARNKYIIIGTICLILAVAVVIAAIILIQNKK